MVGRRSVMYPTCYQILNPMFHRMQPNGLMKAKVSATVDESLLAFLDSLPGKTRSEKLEQVLRAFKRREEDRRLREELAAYVEDDEERLEREAWERTTAEAMWRD